MDNQVKRLSEGPVVNNNFAHGSLAKGAMFLLSGCLLIFDSLSFPFSDKALLCGPGRPPT